MEREFFLDNLLVRIYFIVQIICWTVLAPLEFEFPFPGSLIPTFLRQVESVLEATAELGDLRKRFLVPPPLFLSLSLSLALALAHALSLSPSLPLSSSLCHPTFRV